MEREEKIGCIRESARTILEHYGAEAQHRQLAEECAELAQEALKSIRDEYKRVRRIESEIADVIVMVMQILKYYEISEDTLLSLMKFKTERQLDRIHWDAYKVAHKDDTCDDADFDVDSYGIKRCDGLINEEPPRVNYDCKRCEHYRFYEDED